MQHHIIPPPKHLQNYVRFFWTIDSKETVKGSNVLRIFARRFPRLVFQHNNGFSVINKNDTKLPIAFLSGINRIPYTCKIADTFSLTGVSFYPHAIRPLFNIDAFELLEQLPDLISFAPRQLLEKLIDAPAQQERIKILIEYLTLRLANRSEPDVFTQKCVQGMDFLNDDASIYNLTKYFKISERQLERRFRGTMGLSPKQFLRIKRFEKSLSLIQKGEYSKLSDIAYDLNYTDQAHFIKDFKEFSNYTPKDFLSQHKLIEESSSIIIRPE